MSFNIGEFYTRDYIHAILGGEKVTYLPQKSGKIVCGCFTPKLGPEVPNRVLVAANKRNVKKKAEILIQQMEPIPVFVKQAANKWQYRGQYIVKSYSTDFEELRELAQQAKRDNIFMVLNFMEMVETFVG